MLLKSIRGVQESDVWAAADALIAEGLVIPPISTEPKSRTVMQPWPDAALG